jgi:CubicO group peptidase (beta-lactamase class C family)
MIWGIPKPRGGIVSRKTVRLMFNILFSMTILIACTAPTPATTVTPISPTPIPPIASPETNALAARINQYMQGFAGWGGTILVAQKGNVLISQGYGLADRENDVPNTSQTKFAIGSMTKAFTAMAIMMLQENGLLTVQDPICKYISDCPAAWKPITLHQLLTHTSGIHNYNAGDLPELDNITLCQEFTLEEAMAILKALPQDFAPGSQFSYSNTGYYLLGAVIEKVSGDSYETFIQQNILQPLGMSETGYDRLSTIVTNRASGYDFDQIQGQFVNAPGYDVSQRYAAGGLYSTVGDLYKWDQALYADRLVSKETLTTIFTSMVSVPDLGGYGYGWVISQQSGHRVISHSGGFSGFVSQITRYPDDQVTIIVLTNVHNEDPYQITNALADMVFADNGGITMDFVAQGEGKFIFFPITWWAWLCR